MLLTEPGPLPPVDTLCTQKLRVSHGKDSIDTNDRHHSSGLLLLLLLCYNTWYLVRLVPYCTYQYVSYVRTRYQALAHDFNGVPYK